MNRDKDVFSAALALTGAARATYLDQACAGDSALRDRIEVLLRAHELAQSFLTSPLTRPVVPPSPEERPSDVIGRYKLLEKIGEGGCGVVWMAEQEVPVRRRVALKVIKLGMDTKSVIARFEAERQALALMDHPNIAKVFDAGTTEAGRPYFVMELVRGIPITRYCDEGNLSTAQRLQLFISVCHAIQHAHQKGIIHRDIKPSNILVAQHDDVAVAKVIDFGIAKATQGRLTDATVFTAFEQFIGTPAYMSPEQAEFSGLDVDTRSDVYSLGVLLYELLTGKPPFDPKSLQQAGLDEIRRIIREVEPPRPSTRLSTLAIADRTALAKLRGVLPGQLSTQMSGDLDWIVMKALDKNRTRRYESASAFALDVQRHLGHEPIAARPPSQAYLLQKLIRRHRVAFATASAIAVVLVAGATVSTWQAIRATRAERTALRGEQEQSRLRATESALRHQADAQAQMMRRQSYASDMNRVQQGLTLANLGGAQALLERQRPKSGESDLRGWEWRYLWQFCRSEASWTLTDKPIQAPWLSISSDGNWLVIGAGPDKGLWNLRSRQQSPIPGSDAADMLTAVFSPTEPLLAIQSMKRNDPASALVTLWNIATQQVVREWPLENFCDRIGFSADGKSLFGLLSWNVMLWNVATGAPVRTFKKPGSGSAIAFSSEARFAAMEDRNGSVRVADLASGRDLWSAKAAVEHISNLAFSPNGKILATAGGGAETTVRLWDAATGTELGTLNGHRAVVHQLVFWPDGKTLATGSTDQTIRLWDVPTQRLKRTLSGHQNALANLKLLPDNTTLVSSAGDRTVRFWDTTAPQAPGAHSELSMPILRWAFAADSKSVVTVDRAGNVRRWHGRDFREKDHLLTIPSVYITNIPPETRVVCLPGNIPLVAALRPDGVVQVWNWERGTLEGEIRSPVAKGSSATATERTLPVAFLDGGKKLLLSCESADIKLRGLYEWDLATGQQTRAWPRTTLRGEYVISPDGRSCLVRAQESPAHVPAEPPSNNLERGARSVIDLVAGEERTLEGVTAGEESAGFSPDGKLLAAPLIQSTVVYRTPDFQPARTLPGGIHGTHGTAFSPDGHRLAVTASGVEAVRIWDTTTWEHLLTLEAPASAFLQTAFSADGSILGAMSFWGTLHLWRAPSWEEIAAAEVLAPPKP